MTDLSSRLQNVIAPVITYDSQIEIVEGDGTWVTDSNGNRYIDFACGIAVTNLGHRPPRVLAAAEDQLSRLWHAGGSFLSESVATAAEKIIEVTPDTVEQVFFMNSGAEAVEASVKLARKTSGRQGIVVFRGGFHGRSMGSVSYTTSRAKYRSGYFPLVPSVFVAPFPHPYRWNMSQEDANAYALNELRLMFKHEVAPDEIAAFLFEPLQGEGGYYPAGYEFMKKTCSTLSGATSMMFSAAVATDSYRNDPPACQRRLSWSSAAARTLGGRWPRFVTAIPQAKSIYRLPLLSVTHVPSPSTISI